MTSSKNPDMKISDNDITKTHYLSRSLPEQNPLYQCPLCHIQTPILIRYHIEYRCEVITTDETILNTFTTPERHPKQYYKCPNCEETICVGTLSDILVRR